MCVRSLLHLIPHSSVGFLFLSAARFTTFLGGSLEKCGVSGQWNFCFFIVYIFLFFRLFSVESVELPHNVSPFVSHIFQILYSEFLPFNLAVTVGKGYDQTAFSMLHQAPRYGGQRRRP